MKVSELIEILKTFPQDAEVFVEENSNFYRTYKPRKTKAIPRKHDMPLCGPWAETAEDHPTAATIVVF